MEDLAQLAGHTGITLIQLAIGFVLNHPAIVVWDEAVLDRIDAIVAPGTTINPADNSFNNPALEQAARRR